MTVKRLNFFFGNTREGIYGCDTLYNNIRRRSILKNGQFYDHHSVYKGYFRVTGDLLTNFAQIFPAQFFPVLCSKSGTGNSQQL